jgi:hypothetical protein
MATVPETQYLNITADGNTTVPEWRSGLRGCVGTKGTFGSGTLSLEFAVIDSAGGIVWGSFGSSADLTAEGGYEFVSPGSQIRFVMASSSTPDVDVNISKVIERDN